VPYIVAVSTSTTVQTAVGGVLAERRTSPGLLLALLGQDAMRLLRTAHTAYDLTPRQFQLLALLHDHGAMGQRALGQAIGVAPSILVTLLNPLEAAGDVSRAREASDRRRHVVTITPAGERHLSRAAQAQREAEEELFGGLTAEQREQLRGLLVALRDTIADVSCHPRGGCDET
jgi:DNA-binding MarR family transcriptional regulator